MASTKVDKDGLFRRGGIFHCWIRGKRVSTRCRSRKAAIAVRSQLERAAHDPVFRAAVASGVGECAALTLEAVKRRGRADQTSVYYRSKLGQLVRILGADTRLSQLDAGSVNRFIDQRRAEGVSQHTLSKELGALRQMLRVAKYNGRYPGDIDALFPVGFDGGYSPRRRYLTWDEIPKLLAALQPRHRGWVAFALATGGRESEVARAERQDVAPTLDVVQLRGTKTELADDAVAIPSAFRPWLKLALELGGEKVLFGVWSNSVRDLAAACKRAGIPKVSPNDLRRTHATLMRKSGVSTDLVARQLRHADTRMVERVYGRLSAEDVRDQLTARETHSGEPTEADVGVSDEDRTRDNWSHKPDEGVSEPVILTLRRGNGGVRALQASDAPHANRTMTRPLYLLAKAYFEVTRQVAR